MSHTKHFKVQNRTNKYRTEEENVADSLKLSKICKKIKIENISTLSLESIQIYPTKIEIAEGTIRICKHGEMFDQ